MNLADLSSRIKRLEQLSMNLSKEEHRVFKGELRLYFEERREYLKAIREANCWPGTGSRCLGEGRASSAGHIRPDAQAKLSRSNRIGSAHNSTSTEAQIMRCERCHAELSQLEAKEGAAVFDCGEPLCPKCAQKKLIETAADWLNMDAMERGEAMSEEWIAKLFRALPKAVLESEPGPGTEEAEWMTAEKVAEQAKLADRLLHSSVHGPLHRGPHKSLRQQAAT
jgi:hypothetical protein